MLGNAVEAIRQARKLRTLQRMDVAVLDDSDRDLSSKLRLSLTAAPGAQSLM